MTIALSATNADEEITGFLPFIAVIIKMLLISEKNF
jgi:hypothetical protein